MTVMELYHRFDNADRNTNFIVIQFESGEIIYYGTYGDMPAVIKGNDVEFFSLENEKITVFINYMED